MSLSLSYRKKLEMQMKFYHKSNVFSCQILSRALTYCKSFDDRRTPINPKEIAEKFEKSNMQILAVKTEIRNKNKTNGIGGSSWRCIRHVSVNWQVARYVMAVFNITTITDFATIVAITIDMLCTNCFKVTPFSGSQKKSVLSRRGLPSSSGWDGLLQEGFRW